ncbi:MAG: prepilin-type N-terminal cleavage/methylation domain-containing protein, partial [Intestinibaculum porci]|uniref:prepilin-type N-terminal cleavage/methylation domain-containing protein n=1 Tax=Intestinibaculum porci TaxID=2487118 RepID=UPI002408FDD6
MLREKLRNKKGFTLIEIIVVIVILAVLMAVAVPSVMSYMSEGQNAKYETVARAA